jgi:peptidyl-prolyl cis-trans isomerase A (cyclophilin A)
MTIARVGWIALAGAVIPACSCGHAPIDDGGAAAAPTPVSIPIAAPQGSAAPWATVVASAAPRATSDAGAKSAVGAHDAGAGVDPLAGEWSLADATESLVGSGPIRARIDTARGALTCTLFADRAPATVANFIGLARGVRPWRDGAHGAWVKRPFYDGTTFYRVIRGFMIQGGAPAGDISGGPGYAIEDEVWPGATHDRAGLLCMANAGPNTAGSQFFITDGPAKHLDKSFTIFGECAPIATIHALASWPVAGDKAIDPPSIRTITISRDREHI